MHLENWTLWIMMQLWEGNSKENVLQMDIKIICKGKNTIFAKRQKSENEPA